MMGSPSGLTDSDFVKARRGEVEFWTRMTSVQQVVKENILTDGDYGDILVSDAGATWTIDSAVVDNSKLSNMAAQTIKGRNTAGTGSPEDLSVSTIKSLLSLSGTNSGDNATNTQYSGLAASKQDTLVSATNIKTVNGSSILGSGNLIVGGGVADADYGDITVSSSGTVWTIDNSVVTNAKMADMTTKTYKGRTSGTTGAPEDISLSTLKTDLGLPQTTVSGNAGTATALQTARNIGGASFDGTTDINPTTIAVTNEATDTTCFLCFFISATGNLQPKSNSGLKYNSNTNVLEATTFIGALTGTASGNLTSGGALGTPSSGTLTNCTFPTLNQDTSGSAATLTTSRNIGGSAFNGSADVTPLNTTVANEATDTTCFPTFVTSATGDLPQRTNAALTFNSNTGSLAATTFVGALTGTASGNLTSDGALGTPSSGTLTNCTFPTLNQNTSGTASNVSGTPALPNGTTATTQTAADNSTKLATTAYVDTGLALKAPLASPTLTGTPNISAATGTSLSVTGAVTSSGGGIGYATGAGSTASQGTSRTTTVAFNKLCGTITMFSAAQVAQAIVTFTFTNTFIAAGDFILIQHISATNAGAWQFSVVAAAGSCAISIRNVSTASITEATPLRFVIIKAVTA